MDNSRENPKNKKDWDKVDKTIKAMKEIICPECEEEIEYLNYHIEKQEQGQLSVENGREEWDSDDIKEIELIEEEYICPHCGEVLFKDYYQAMRFLKGKDDKK